MSHTILGTCSICGGRVAVPNVWLGIYPPAPACLSCKAVAADSGPIIKMKPAGSRNRSLPPRIREKSPEEMIAAEMGKRGGLKGGPARAAALSPEQRSKIARKAARARWSKKP